ncbi:geranylgeranyl diphosphate synthase [Daldinia grandis]|nr:geranylgeranyl diphosphate synthase [Daldinia grandis]
MATSNQNMCPSSLPEDSSPPKTGCTLDDPRIHGASLGFSPNTTVSETAHQGYLLSVSDEVQNRWASTRSQVAKSPHDYISALPSKCIREKFIDALNTWFDSPQETVIVIKRAINMLHNSSLILDDFEDSSILRRGKPATHTVFGPAQSINSASYIIIKAVSEIQSFFGSASAVKATDMILTLFEGQAMDLNWTYNDRCPSVQDYMMMVDDKTGALFRLACHLLGAHAKADLGVERSKATQALVTIFGRYFQIRDDYMNLVDADYTSQKGFCEDLDEGKYSLVLIHALQNDAGGFLLGSVLSTRRVQGKLTTEQKLLVLDQVRACGSLEWTSSLLSDLLEQTVVEIRRLEEAFDKENYDLRALVDMLQH